MQTSNHKLNTEFVPTQNQGGIIKPRYLVYHFTGSGDLDPPGRSIRSVEAAESVPTADRDTVDWFLNPRASASAHVIIGHNGRTIQMVPFNRMAWHAGKSAWLGLSGLNRHSIGIEICNWGALQKTERGSFLNYLGREVKTQVVHLQHKNETSPRYWEAYRSEQIAKAIELGTLLVETYGLEDVIGHDDIAPRRKNDPGPAFPLERIRAKIFGRPEVTEEEDSGESITWATVVNVSRTLNVRAGPGTGSPIIGSLTKGQEIQVLEANVGGGWSRIVHSWEAYVLGSIYLKFRS